MDTTTLLTLIGTIVATLGGKEAWAYYKTKAKHRADAKKLEIGADSKARKELQDILDKQIEDLKEQIETLEGRVGKVESERDDYRDKYTDLSVRVAVLTERLGKYALKSRGSRKSE